MVFAVLLILPWLKSYVDNFDISWFIMYNLFRWCWNVEMNYDALMIRWKSVINKWCLKYILFLLMNDEVKNDKALLSQQCVSLVELKCDSWYFPTLFMVTGVIWILFVRGSCTNFIFDVYAKRLLAISMMWKVTVEC